MASTIVAIPAQEQTDGDVVPANGDVTLTIDDGDSIPTANLLGDPFDCSCGDQLVELRVTGIRSHCMRIGQCVSHGHLAVHMLPVRMAVHMLHEHMASHVAHLFNTCPRKIAPFIICLLFLFFILVSYVLIRIRGDMRLCQM